MKRLLLALLLCATGARGAVALDTVLVTGSQDNLTGGAATFVSPTFNIAASRLVVVLAAYESDISNTPTTLAWTGGTPACATAFTRVSPIQGYNDGVGDTQGAEAWWAWTTSACTGVGFTHTNAVTISSGIASVIGAVSLSGSQQAIPIGAVAISTPQALTTGTANVSITALHTGSMIVGVVGTSDSPTTTLTPASGTTAFAGLNIRNPTAQMTAFAGQLTALTSGPGTVTFGSAASIDFRMGIAIEVNDASVTPPGSTCVPSQALLGVTAC